MLTATAGGGVTVPADAVVWGAAAAETLVPFCIDAPIWAHAVWNDVGVHNPDPAADCLGKGQTSMLLAPGVLPAGAADQWQPDDSQQAAIDADPRARATFATLSAQNRFALAFQTHNMKTDAGRRNKIAGFVAMLGRGETPHPQTKK